MSVERSQENEDATPSRRSLEEAVQGVLEHHTGLHLDDEHDRRLLLEALVAGITPEQAAPLVDQPIPTNWVAKEDLVYCRPELAEKIAALTQSEVAYIADKIGDALQETYWTAMGITLDEYLGDEDTLGDEAEDEQF